MGDLLNQTTEITRLHYFNVILLLRWLPIKVNTVLCSYVMKKNPQALTSVLIYILEASKVTNYELWYFKVKHK